MHTEGASYTPDHPALQLAPGHSAPATTHSWRTLWLAGDWLGLGVPLWVRGNC